MGGDDYDSEENGGKSNLRGAMVVFDIACWVAVALALTVATFLWVR